MKLPRNTLIRVLAAAQAAHDQGVAGTVVGNPDTVTYAFRTDADEYYCITYRATRRFLRKPIIEAQATFHPRRKVHMELLLRHEHPGQRVLVDRADLAGDTGTTLQPLSPHEQCTYELTEPLYTSWDRQIAAELNVR